MTSIKVLRGCGASGQSLAAGTVYAVPAQVSESDALLLVRLGKAVFIEEQPKPAKPKKVKDSE